MSDYHLRIRGSASQVVARLELDADAPEEALDIACAVISPHGHDLFEGNRFVAHFDAQWGDHLDEEELEEGVVFGRT